MKVTIILSTILALGLAAPSPSPLDARSELQDRGIGSGCLVYGICKPLKHALENKKDPSAQKTYDTCKKSRKAVGKICDFVACSAIVGSLTLNPAAEAAANGICARLT